MDHAVTMAAPQRGTITERGASSKMGTRTGLTLLGPSNRDKTDRLKTDAIGRPTPARFTTYATKVIITNDMCYLIP